MARCRRFLVCRCPLWALALLAASGLGVQPLAGQGNSSRESAVHHAVAFGISPPLRELAKLPQKPQYGFRLAPPVRRIAKRPVGPVVDTVEQSSTASGGVAYSIGANFIGVGNGFPNYSVPDAPPDANMAVGDTQIVQWVNVSYTVCSKTSPYTCGPAIAGNTLWTALGGICASNNDGDIIAQWDVQAHRWLLAQNVFTGTYGVCVAVSTSNDATGTYYLYEFPVVNIGFPDYPKWGTWVNNYGQTWNNFGPGGSGFVGPVFCAYNRAKMLAGDQTAEQICHQYTISPNFEDSLLPADIDSITAPPTGEDQFAIGSVGDIDNSHLSLYSVHINNPNNWTQGADFTGEQDDQLIAIATFTPACNGAYGGACVPQKGIPDLLDSLGDRLMYRFAYYNDSPLLPPIDVAQLGVFQQGTYAPDGNWRWMGSVARDKFGDILVGYSESCGDTCPGGTPTYPSIYVAGRQVNDPLGLGQLEAEVQVVGGSGSQPGTSNRWGDYSVMRIDTNDGTDGCTLWYTTEYYTVTQTFDWSTQIASVKFSGCNAAGASPQQPAGSQQHWYVNFDVTASGGQNGVRWMELVAPGLQPVFSNLTPSQSITYGTPSITLSGTICASGPVCPPKGEQVTITIQGQPPQTATISDNTGDFSTTYPTGTIPVAGSPYTITYSYAGDNDFNPATNSSTNLTVNKATTATAVALTSGSNPSTYGQPLIFTAAVTPQISGTPTGTATFFDNGTAISICTNQPLTPGDNQSTATCNISTLDVAHSPHSITATYDGDNNFSGSTSPPIQQTVNQATTTTTITDVEPPSPSSYGMQVTFTAQVTGQNGGSPTRTMTIQDITGGTPVTICTGTLSQSSKRSKRSPGGNGSTATCKTSNPLSVGTHSVQATYSGDTNYQTSNSTPPISYTVAQAITTTTTQLTSSLNPSDVNQPVTLTATLTALDHLPTGNVTFTSRGQTISECPNPVPVMQVGNNSVATCNTQSLPPGTDTILASFNDPQGVYGPSSATLAQLVQDFSLLPISPGAVTVIQGFDNSNEPFFAQTINLTVQPLYGYGGTVALSCSVSPTLAGGTCLVDPPASGSLAGGNLNTTLTISAGSSTPIGSYAVTVTAQDGSGLMHFATLALSVINNATQITMPPGGANRTPVSFNGPTGTSVGNFSCPLVSGTGITGSEDLSKIGGVCTFSPGSVTLPGSVVVTISGCTVAVLRPRTQIFATLWLGMPAIVLLGSVRNKRLSRKRMLHIVAMLLLTLVLLTGAGCGGGYGQLTPTGYYSVLVQGTGTDGVVYSAVVPVKVVPLSN